MPDLDLAELDRLLFMPSEHNEATSLFMFMRKHWPSLRARIAELERKAKAFDAIRELFDRFDTRFAGARDQVLLTDDLLERTRDAISAAVAAKESKQ